mgnify:CR=1 FL=1
MRMDKLKQVLSEQVDKLTVHDNKLAEHDEKNRFFGTALKDLGKKWFVFSKIQLDIKELLSRL